MFEIQGKYSSAKVFTNQADEASVRQVIELLNQPYASGSQIRMMPDIQAGVGCTVGTTMSIKDKVCPNIVGVDIGCGMEVAVLREQEIDLPLLDQIIHEQIPAGFAKRAEAHRYIQNTRIGELRCKINAPTVQVGLGTLGGGNHFIELDRDDDGRLYLVIHSGSRVLGVKVAAYYQRMAYDQCRHLDPVSIASFISNLKAAGRTKEIERELKTLHTTAKSDVPEDLAYLSGYLLDDYLHDMEIVQEYAEWNRNAMADTILKAMELHLEDRFTTVHNYIDTENMILRKGAVSAQAGERLIIPINMRDGSLICIGKGNPDWNYSAPHGAGRLYSRAKAKELFSVDEFQVQMSGVYTTSVGQSTLDECPMAYRDMASIVENIEPTAEIQKIIRPIYNFKARNEAGGDLVG